MALSNASTYVSNLLGDSTRSHSMAFYLLHGTFQCTIYRAEDLLDEARLSGQAPKFIRKVAERIEDTLKLGKGPSRIYATIQLGSTTVGRTRIVEHDPVNPEWNENFHIYCAHSIPQVNINVKCDDALGAHLIGRARIPMTKVLPGKPVKDSYELYIDGNPKKRGKIKIKFQFFSVLSDPFWGSGVLGSDHPRVPFTFFPQRTGCRITLYQDAHMQQGFLPQIYLRGGMFREPTRCWEDISNAISNAKHLIYIAGWSVNASIRLVRDGSNEITLGELLKRKADEGVRVLLLVWDDRTSQRGMPASVGGIMGTHDEETFNYFRSSNVKCVLCPRNPDSGLSVVQGMTVGAMFTHHQKTVTVDSSLGPLDHPHSHNYRTIVSFLGGIDLCDGRYDNQKHSLFRTLNSEHRDDFYNGCFKGASRDCGGPREPWHDIHARLEGPAAWDVLTNFEQRWTKQGQEGYLLEIPKIRDIIPMNPITDRVDTETWNAQIFRSIDGGAAAGFPTLPEEASNAGLITGKDHVIERSIQDAYIHAIRRAKNFIYIENQYFLGSCASWDTMQDAGCTHLIPIELALKIVSKIEAGERFAVYVVIPMWPEGVPDSLTSVQPILDWQRKTMEMMYRQISQALHAKGMYDAHPKDYLSFFCLGNREAQLANEYEPVTTIPDNPNNFHYRKAQENRRFMIYVHSKMMIVDDEYIIVGSANINQRSMDGGRDSEIAVGGYQPYHTAAGGQPPRGQIHGFRMSLWYEHMGLLVDDFLYPNSIQCMRRVSEIGEATWAEFIREESPVTRDLPGHLMSYPVDVREDGLVSEREGLKWLPDTKAAVLGSKSLVPPILTT